MESKAKVELQQEVKKNVETKSTITKEKIAKKEKAKGKKMGKDNSAIVKENPGKIKNRPATHLSREDFLRIQVSNLQIDKVRLEIDNLSKQIDNNNKTNLILSARLTEKKREEKNLRDEYIKFIDNIKERTGIDIKGKTIDFLTNEVYGI